MTDEQIIAAAGEPVAFSNKSGTSIVQADHKQRTIEEGKYGGEFACAARMMDGFDKPLYTADAILAAAKPLKEEIERLKTVPMKYRRMTFNAQLQDENAKLLERIAELEANASTMKAYYEQVFEDGGKRISELTKQRDGAMADAERWRFIELHWSAADIRNNKDGSFKSMTITFKSEQLSDQINRDKLCRGFDAAIAANKTGGAA